MGGVGGCGGEGVIGKQEWGIRIEEKDGERGKRIARAC